MDFNLGFIERKKEKKKWKEDEMEDQGWEDTKNDAACMCLWL